MTRSNLHSMANMKMTSCLFMLVTLLILLPDAACGKNQYPEWFLEPEKYPELFIGYSIAGVLDAQDDAIWRLSFQQRGFLSGKASYFNNDDKWEKAYITEANAPALSRNQIIKLARIPTSIYGGGEEISLFKRINSEFDESTKFPLQYPDKVRPTWVDLGPFYQDKEYYYGVGQYVLKGNENDAWRTAEERALIELASAIGIEVQSNVIDRRWRRSSTYESNNEETISIITYTFNHEIVDAKVLQRWIDYPETNPDQNLNTYIYVLMSIPKDNIKYNIPSER